LSEGNGLPSGWTKAPLGSFADILGGSTPPRANPDNFGGDIVWLTPTEIPKDNVSILADSREKLTETGFNSGGIRWIPEGSVLLTSRASIGFVAIAGTRLTTNQGFASFVLPDEFAPKFLGWWLRFQKSHLEDRAGGTTFKEISKAKLRDISAPLAPFAEQRRIVAAIEEQFTRLEAGVAALERVRKGLKRYRASVLKAAVEGRLTKEWREENPDAESGSALLERILVERRAKWEEAQLAGYAAKEQNPPKNWRSKYKEPAAPDTADLPELPQGWCWATVDHGLSEDMINGLSVKGSDSPPGIAALKLDAMTANGFDFSRVRYLPVEKTRVEHLWIQEGDFFISRGNGTLSLVGRGSTAQKPPYSAIFPDTMIRVRITSSLRETGWIAAIWQSSIIRSQIEAKAKTTAGIHKVSQADLKSITLPLPPLAEQEEIVAEVERRLSVIEEVEAQVEAGLKRAARLRQSILKRAFEGKLVPQDPSDEPASMLLERIREEREQSAARKPKRNKPAKKSPKGKQASLFSAEGS